MEDLSTSESENLEKIINDLEALLEKNRIELEELDELEQNLQSDEVENYLRDLREGSKPETALREELLAGNSTLANYILGEKEPEVSTTDGFIDYKTKKNSIPILIELKPLFTPVYREESGHTVLKYLKESSLDWKDHHEQIEKYLRENEFLILTNLKHWYFFSKRAREPIKEEPITFEKFNDDFERIENLRDFLERFEESQTIKGDLDKHFFNNLDNWVSALDSVDYKEDVSQEEKIESIINLINKFIFIQTLDDHFVIDFHWIRGTWEEKESKWQQMGEKKILTEFLEEINDWFYAHYDTELFRTENEDSILQLLEDDGGSVSKFYEKLKRVLGLEHWQRVTSARGIVNYNYRQIDEDIFGKAYETYLAEVRKEQGIYYTPKYITQYIVKETVGKKFDNHLQKIKESLDGGNYNKAREELEELTDIKVLDPACGSGSFLIKAVREIWQRYTELIDKLKEMNTQISKGSQTLEISEENRELREAITDLYEILGFKPQKGENRRVLMSKLILRHIYGNDLDAKALSVAKVNIWLSAIKLIPQEYRYERISEGSGYSLPDLEINLGHGDSLVGLPNQVVKDYLRSNHAEEIQNLIELRNKYLSNPRNEDPVEEIKEIISNMESELDNRFKDYLRDQELPIDISESTKPFYWPLQFSKTFKEDMGFDIVIGNPPYVKAKLMDEKLRNYFDKLYESSTASYDIYVNFIERSLKLLNKEGEMGFINPSKFVQTDYGEGIRNYILKNAKLDQFIDFQDAQVFEDPTNYTCILLLGKPKKESYEFRFSKVKNPSQNLEAFVQELADNISDDSQVRKSDYNILTGSSKTLTGSRWDFMPKEELDVLNSLERNRDTLEDYVYKVFVGAQITPVEVFEVRILDERNENYIIKPSDPQEGEGRYEVEKDLVKPLLKSSDIHDFSSTPKNRHIIFPYKFGELVEQEYEWELIQEEELKENWPKTHNYLEEHKKNLEGREDGRWKGSDRWYEYSRQQNFGCHPLPKIITPGIETSANFAADDGEFYIDRGSYGIIIDENKDLTQKYLLGLLNSKVLDFYLQNISPIVSGGYYAYQTKYLNQLPIQEEENAEEIKKLVEEITSIRPIPPIYNDLWEEVSEQLKSDSYSLKRLLNKDQKAIQNNKPDKSWFQSVSFYPEQNNDLMKKEYSDFILESEPTNFLLEIYGLEGQLEEKIYEIKFKDIETMQMVYLALEELLGSRKKVQKLKDILQKTEVPIIRPNIFEKSPNIIKELRRKLEKLRRDYGVGGSNELEVVEAKNKIKDIKNEIDARVFSLYGLNKKQSKIVLDYLNIRESIKHDILDKFDNLG